MCARSHVVPPYASPPHSASSHRNALLRRVDTCTRLLILFDCLHNIIVSQDGFVPSNYIEEVSERQYTEATGAVPSYVTSHPYERTSVFAAN